MTRFEELWMTVPPEAKAQPPKCLLLPHSLCCPVYAAAYSLAAQAPQEWVVLSVYLCQPGLFVDSKFSVVNASKRPTSTCQAILSFFGGFLCKFLINLTFAAKTQCLITSIDVGHVKRVKVSTIHSTTSANANITLHTTYEHSETRNKRPDRVNLSPFQTMRRVKFILCLTRKG